MRRIPVFLIVLVVITLLVSGCGATTGTHPEAPPAKAPSSPPKAVVSGVPLSRFNAPPLDTADFVSAAVGFVAGANLVYRTAAGGNSWHKVFAAAVNTGAITGYGPATPWHAAIAAGTSTNAGLLVYGGAEG